MRWQQTHRSALGFTQAVEQPADLPAAEDLGGGGGGGGGGGVSEKARLQALLEEKEDAMQA